MLKEQRPSPPMNNNFHAENFNQTQASGNFTKHHQFLFPSHLYKRLFDTSLFPKSTTVIAPTTVMTSSPITVTSTIMNTNKIQTNNSPGAPVTESSSTGAPPPIPRNLLFSCTDDSGKSDEEGRNKENEEKPENFHWNENGVRTNGSVIHSHITAGTNAGTKIEAGKLENQNQSHHVTSSSVHSLNLMPIVTTTQSSHQPQANSAQGLVHWMSAVMAEHMTSNPVHHHHHHDPTVQMHYMWNDGKLAVEHPNGIHKDENHQNVPSIYGTAITMKTTTSSNSNSPAHTQNLALVVPHTSKLHVNTTPSSSQISSSKKYQCKMCPQIFSGKSELQMHTQAHMRETKPYKCSQCTKSFANSSYLSQHTRIHLGIKPYRCEICQRKFTQLSHLQQHIRTHTGDKPYKCRHPGCPKAFSQLSNLQSHSRCHATDKPYKCNSCYKCFTDETALLEHIPKHKESKHLKTHICQYCGKSYTQETYLSKHLQKHIERAEKRASGLSGLGLARNLGINNAAALVGSTEHPYWPKVSPDSAATLAEAMQQQQQNQYDFAIGQHGTTQQTHGNNEHIQTHRAILEHQRNGSANGSTNGNNGTEEVGEDLVVIRQNSNNITQHLAANGNQPNGAQNPPPSSSANTIVVTTTGAYDASSITKTTTNSAFTPINAMPTHLNTLQHHQLAQRPYIYDAISFQNKNVAQNTTNAFPNQLISLHQIRNYAHQPSGLMAGEHLLGISVGDKKGQ